MRPMLQLWRDKKEELDEDVKDIVKEGARKEVGYRGISHLQEIHFLILEEDHLYV